MKEKKGHGTYVKYNTDIYFLMFIFKDCDAKYSPTCTGISLKIKDKMYYKLNKMLDKRTKFMFHLCFYV